MSRNNEKQGIYYHLKSCIFVEVGWLRISGRMLAPSEVENKLYCACTFHPEVAPTAKTYTFKFKLSSKIIAYQVTLQVPLPRSFSRPFMDSLYNLILICWGTLS